MYLQKLSITNFRKYGESEDSPGIVVKFNKGLNVLIGENESGKTTIVDAIRFVLQTQSYDYIRLEDIDFHYHLNNRTDSLKIECEFKGFTNAEAGNFLEWIGFDDKNEYVLRVWLNAERKDNRILQEVRAGMDNVGTQLDAGARDLLRTTYLKPLRDAEIEMSAGRRSRFAQLLKSRSEFKCKTQQEEKDHPLSKLVTLSDAGIRDYFTGNNEFIQQINKEAIVSIELLSSEYSSKNVPDSKRIVDELERIKSLLRPEVSIGGKDIIDTIKDNLTSFTSAGRRVEPFVTLSGVELWAIIQRLTLNIDNNQPSLGLMNLLYIAAELMLLKRENYNGLKLAIIEELEAHLHPHYQINTLKYFTEHIGDIGQIILTTHSIVMGSSVPLASLIICKDSNVFPMGNNENDKPYTEIDPDSLYFLERFLDATKANLFFAKGVIIVEGDAENLLIPALAEVIGLPLGKHGVSIVNVGSTAWKRYVKIFERTDRQEMPVKVAVISDGDVPSREHLIVNPPKVYCHVIENAEVLLETDKTRFKALLGLYDLPTDNIAEKTELKSEHVGDYIGLMKERKTQNQYHPNNNNIRIFPNEWTLEYNLANSVLKDDLLSAMNNARELSEKSLVLPNDSSDAYMMMKPFLGNLSKALTAQFLAKTLLEKKNVLRDSIDNDDQLNYLVNAIKFACGKDV
ncbi:MAG: AAA family ATPase [Candidatus Cloacimonetes bacterium]|nr:AAA family ATPase [Candidatus Cloacimonadota bacterium]MDY0172143.1 AAA family ATPase [Candidatus Cloacimonadaceae bacterium]